MKKGWISVVMALALVISSGAVLPAGRSAAEEILDLETDEEDLRQTEQDGEENALEGTQEETEAVFGEGNLQIEAIEEETESDDPAETEAACTETLAGGSGELCACGRASDAVGSERSLYARTVFGMSYGEQLEENAAEIYRQMEESLKKNGCVAFTCTLTSPLVFAVYPSAAASGRTDWRIESNEEYQNEIISEINGAAQSAYDAFVYDHPEVFWLGKMSYEWKITFRREAGADNGTGTIKEITFTPHEEYPGAVADAADFLAAVQTAVANIRSADSTTEVERLRAIHNYVCTQLTYEEKQGANARAWSAGGAFLYDHKVVCEGYAKMFQILCRQFEISCVLVPGLAMTADGSWESHMWNEVKLENGLWYLVDTTWDDQEEAEELYFLCGSGDYGMIASVTVGEERMTSTNFSASFVAQSFVFPELAGSRYEEGAAIHRHNWREVSRTEPGCTTDGRCKEQCTSCLAIRQEVLPAKGHRFTVYHSNGDATCLADGTKTAACDRCGIATDTLPDQGSRLSPSMKWNFPAVLHMKKGQTTGKGKVWGLARGDEIKMWKSDHPQIVSVQKKTGRLSAKKIGKARISVTLKSGYSRSFVVQVQKKPVKTKKLEASAKRLTLKAGSRTKLSASVRPFTSQEKLKYRSSDCRVVTVSALGVVTARKKGKATILIRSGSQKKRVTVTVTAAGKTQKR